MTISAVAIFVLGSGISGGANNESMLFACCAIQGVGGGGLNVMIDLIVCDLVPLAERPKFMGIVSAMFALAHPWAPLSVEAWSSTLPGDGFSTSTYQL